MGPCSLQYAMRTPEEQMAKKKTHGKRKSLPCATLKTHSKVLAHGKTVSKKLDSAIATFMVT